MPTTCGPRTPHAVRTLAKSSATQGRAAGSLIVNSPPSGKKLDVYVFLLDPGASLVRDTVQPKGCRPDSSRPRHVRRPRWRHQWSVRRRSSRRVLGRIGIGLTSKERDILAVRNTIVHEGHSGNDATPQALEQDFRRGRALANFSNRATLTLLARPGRYLDAATTDERGDLPLTQSHLVSKNA
jgi:hypothetical protein